MVEPLWTTSARAIRWFNYRYSLPKVLWSSLKVLSGRISVGSAEKPLVMTCSISEDYARVWLYFARKSLEVDDWDFLIVDSAGDIDASKFENCRVIRFLNIYHGKKVDRLLHNVLRSETIFLCDDDKYILQDITAQLDHLADPRTPIVSLSPRNWWQFKIDDQIFLPMGSYALLFKRQFLLKHGFTFESPATQSSPYRIFPDGVKAQYSYDTADYMNEQLLLEGYTVKTLPEYDGLSGFDGLSGRRILLMKFGKAYVKQALLEAKHFKAGTTNREALQTLYGIVRFEHVYQHLFQTAPKFVSGFTQDELYAILEQNPHTCDEQKKEVVAYFKHTDSLYERLIRQIEH